MKKFVALFLIVTCLLMAIPSFAFTTHGEALWALSDNQRITGILDPNEVEEYLPAQNPPKPYIRGFLENGMVREKGLQEFCVSASGTYGGLTYITTKVEIFTQYEEIVNEVVIDKNGYEPHCVNDYIIATMYFEDKYVGHVFFKTNISKFHVGNVYVNDGKDIIPLYMGDFDFDGAFDLGFAAGWTQCVTTPPCINIPDVVVIVRPCKPKPPVCKNTIKVVVQPEVRVVNVNTNTTTKMCKPCSPLVQINLFSNVNNCIKVGCGK